MKEDIRNAFLLIVLEFNHEGLCFCFCFVFIAHWQLDSLFGYISHFTGEKRKKKLLGTQAIFKIVNHFYFDYESSTNR